ncbi:MAG: ketoacyl-ACP synthase III [Dysgonamonadaceae bacterium]|jgi:3-oxoacyl-[acyl-carrier-protein] synthase-3|nr:ketoacyl-ACP synthase III [Dysgonamonadaceae bacterium]
MAFLQVKNVKISGLSACVPKQIEENVDFPLFDSESYKNFAATTGIERKRISTAKVCTSDLCIAAAEKLIDSLAWNRDEISVLVFVTQTPDYMLPATSCIIQDKLKLSRDCYALDISLGCSGWVYGLSTAATVVSSCNSDRYIRGGGVKMLLLCGDTISKICTKTDKSTYPLFGDAGTATALEFSENCAPILFNMNSDGSGYQAIIVNDGGYRNGISEKSFEKITRGEGIESNNLQLILDGMDVFSFGIKRAPESVNRLLEEFVINKDCIDYFLFHQANMFMNEQIRKKLKLEKEKVPYSLKNFGNTSSASIPLTMVTELSEKLKTGKLNHIACGFGVGLSWGSAAFETNKIAVPDLVEI